MAEKVESNEANSGADDVLLKDKNDRENCADRSNGVQRSHTNSGIWKFALFSCFAIQMKLRFILPQGVRINNICVLYYNIDLYKYNKHAHAQMHHSVNAVRVSSVFIEFKAAYPEWLVPYCARALQ